ncbi:pre-mRNA-splicing factor CWC22 [Strigomonas culicis]|uniref:Pre-mRNA-splicing factor CWC22 n=1 Tax=Strigomonas culicis TaxID=28005 RepID=S9U5R6_9TRYP|nr:pre-mRNA-splicing factor CWC22 [Strigomonas culicis]EPY24308.1 pre-mRNA-splicing factor CWC22 [Strigomonas culicis]|eukprot:EPY23663.1 pre-mRNA-splicing factor CWC22 [Strigomonas culicis]
MSRYVPPHRKREEDVDLTNPASEGYQRAAWLALMRSITGIFNRLTVETLEHSTVELFRENIIRGRGLLARTAMRTQQDNPDLSPVLCALLSRVNKELPDVVLLLCQRLVVNWNLGYRRRDWLYLENISRFIGDLYLFRIVEVEVVYQILLKHLLSDKRSDEDIDQASKLFRNTFRAMSARSRGTFHQEILTPFRDMLAMDDETLRLSARSQAVLESCMKDVQQWERVKDDKDLIAGSLILFDLEDQTHHDLDLEEPYALESELDRFAHDPDYVAHEAKYEETRKLILGEDWEVAMLEEAAVAEAAADEEEEEDGEALQAEEAHADGSGGAPADTAKHLINEEERKIRKNVYLAMRSSVRADEAVHKILKEMKPQTERTICFMVIEGCCEEKSYKRVYGMTAERLCKSNSRFKAFFVESFHTRYQQAQSLTIKQIEYSCKVFSHLLRTDSLFWSRCFSVMDIVQANESQRLFIQYLFQNLAEEMTMPKLVERLQQDRDLEYAAAKLFPMRQGVPQLEIAIDLYVAMGLGELTAPLRNALLNHKDDRKRPRDD